jgi:uncharacterized protein with GYD domain
MNYTTRGKEALRTTLDGASLACHAVERGGGCVLGLYWSLGRYDVVALVGWPSEADAVAFTLLLELAGEVSVEMTRVYDRRDMGAIMSTVEQREIA